MSLDINKLVDSIVPDKKEEMEEILNNPPDNLKDQEVYNQYCNKLSEIAKFEPRPDLKEDTEYWKKVLRKTKKRDDEIYNLLHFLRCSGVRIKEKNGRLNITPGKEFDDWEKYREGYLMPIKDIIKRILDDVYKDVVYKK